MKEELEIMREREVWKLVEIPTETKILGCRWVFSIKLNEQGIISRYKARLVAQGHQQVRGISYDETFSPVVNFSIIRLFFSILVSLYKWTHLQLDVKAAYLYAPLTEEIYMKQPQGFAENSQVCLLKKAIYGLHQSGRNWYFELHETLTSLGLTKLEHTNCVYIYGRKTLLLLYVDDIVIFGKKQKHVEKALSLIETHFECKILGKTRRLLGVSFEQTDENLYIHQQDYIESVCTEYEDFKISLSSLPIPVGKIYTKIECPIDEVEKRNMSKFPYRNLIGSLAFIANRTRPDISYALNIFSQYQENPGITHWEGLLKLLGYLKYTKSYRLDLSKVTNLNLTAFSDADFAANRDDRISMGGLIVFIDKAPIIWRSFKQKSVCLSTMESEFVALTETSKELNWFHNILSECQELKILKSYMNTPLLYADNQAALDFAVNDRENYKTKHIDIKLRFIRDFIYKQIIQVKYVQSKENQADIFTKPLPKISLNKINEKLFINVDKN